jgi:hypothetical protein
VWRAHAWALWLLAAVALAPLAMLEMAGLHFNLQITTRGWDLSSFVVNLLVILVFEIGSAELEAVAAEKMVSSDLLGRPMPGIRQFARELPWGRLILATVVFEVAVVVGFLLLVVPGILVGVYWVFYGPVIVVERAGIRAAFRRSTQLVRGSFWRVLALTLTVLLVGDGAVAIVTVLLDGTPHWVHVLGDYGVDVLLTPLQGVGVAVVYFTLVSREQPTTQTPEEAGEPAEKGA